MSKIKAGILSWTIGIVVVVLSASCGSFLGNWDLRDNLSQQSRSCYQMIQRIQGLDSSTVYGFYNRDRDDGLPWNYAAGYVAYQHKRGMLEEPMFQ